MHKILCQLLISSIGLFFILKASAQEQDLCTQQLEEARNQFNQGRFYDLDTLLADCINNGFNRQERVEALELLSLSKLYLDRLKEADSIYLELLRQDPEHEINPLLDPPDLMFLHNKFITDPLFYWSVIGGINFSNITQIYSDYSIYGLEGENNIIESYNSLPGYEFGAGIELNLINSLYAGGELLFSRTNFQYTQSGLGINNEYTEADDWINIPLFLRYSFGKNRIRPYVYGGAGFDLLLFVTQNITRQEGQEGQGEGGSPESIIEKPELRNRINFSGIFGAGIRIKTNGPSILAIDLKASGGLTNIVKELNRFPSGQVTDSRVIIDDQPMELIGQHNIDFGYVDDPIRLNHLTLTIRYVRPYYKPRLKNPE